MAIKKSFTQNGLTYWILVPEIYDKSYNITNCTLNWTTVASEGGTYAASGNVMARFGANSSWNYAWKTGTIYFNNDYWGDPIYGTEKVGQIANSATITITPTFSDNYTYQILKDEPATYQVNINIKGAGSVIGYGQFSAGQTCTLLGQPNSGNRFIGWEVN